MADETVTPDLNAEEIAVLKGAPYTLHALSNVASGTNRTIMNLARWGYLTATRRMGRDPSGAEDGTSYTVSEKGVARLERQDEA